jgi:hypothetical protein
VNDRIGRRLFCFPFFFFKREKGDKDARLTERMHDWMMKRMVKETEKDTQTEKETIQVQESFIKKEISGERYISSAFPCSDTMIK